MTIKLHKILVAIIVFITIIFAILPFYRITIQDNYFPYEDAYTTKYLSENVFRSDFVPYTWDYSFYMFINIFHRITNLDYYYIIRYGNYVSIILMLIALSNLYTYFLGRKFLPSNLAVIFLGIMYYFSYYMNIFRFSMTLRENFYIPLGIIFLVYSDNLTVRRGSVLKMFILSFLLASIISGHLLAAYIVVGTMIIRIVINIFSRKQIYSDLILLFLSSIFSIHFLKYEIPALLGQTIIGNNLIESLGSTINDTKIQSFHLNIPYDYIFVPLGALSYIQGVSRISIQKYKLLTSMSLTIIILYLASYVTSFGIKQDRLLVYISILSTFFFIYFVINFIKGLNSKYFLSILLISLLFTKTILSNFNFKINRPINSKNISQVSKYILHNSTPLDNHIHCGYSACTLINYLYPSTYRSITKISNSNYNDIDESDTVFILKYDEYLLGRLNPEIPSSLVRTCNTLNNCYIEDNDSDQ